MDSKLPEPDRIAHSVTPERALTVLADLGERMGLAIVNDLPADVRARVATEAAEQLASRYSTQRSPAGDDVLLRRELVRALAGVFETGDAVSEEVRVKMRNDLIQCAMPPRTGPDSGDWLDPARWELERALRVDSSAQAAFVVLAVRCIETQDRAITDS